MPADKPVAASVARPVDDMRLWHIQRHAEQSVAIGRELCHADWLYFRMDRLENALSDCLDVIEPVRDELRKQGKDDAATACGEVIAYARSVMRAASVS